MRFLRLPMILGVMVVLTLCSGGIARAAEKAADKGKPAEKPAAGRSEIVARVGDRVITAEEFNLIYKRLGRGNPQMASLAKKREVLEQAIDQILLFDEARRQGVDRRPVVRMQIEEAVSKILIQAMLREAMAKARDVSDADVQAYWKAHPEEFQGSPKIRLRHIFIAFKDPQSLADKDQTSIKAGEVLKKLKQGEPFDILARRQSDDPATRDRGGDMGYMELNQVAPYLVKAIEHLKPGEVSPPIAGPFGYHLIKMEEREEKGRVLPFEEAKEEAKQKLVRDMQKTRFDEILANLRKKTQVEINEQALRGL